jgi:hypothetical protein
MSFPDLIGESSLFQYVLDCPVKPHNDSLDIPFSYKKIRG